MKELVYFNAAWCGPCKAMKPILQEFMETHQDVELVSIDADEQYELAIEIGVRAIPTFVLKEDGLEVRRKQGAMTPTVLETFVFGE